MTTVAEPQIHERSEPRFVRPVRAEPPRNDRFQRLQSVLFGLGSVLLPLGLLVILLGWYGVAHTPHLYDQMAYLASGGLFGLGLTIAGGFLYFGAWLAASIAHQRENAWQLSNMMLTLTDAVQRMERDTASEGGAASQSGVAPDAGAAPPRPRPAPLD